MNSLNVRVNDELIAMHLDSTIVQPLLVKYYPNWRLPVPTGGAVHTVVTVALSELSL